MPNPFKFITDIDTKARGLSRDNTRRSLDAIDDLRTENARLRKELFDVRDENNRLKTQLGKPASAPVQPKVELVSIKQEVREQVEDDTAIRFSMLELD